MCPAQPAQADTLPRLWEMRRRGAGRLDCWWLVATSAVHHRCTAALSIWRQVPHQACTRHVCDEHWARWRSRHPLHPRDLPRTAPLPLRSHSTVSGRCAPTERGGGTCRQHTAGAGPPLLSSAARQGGCGPQPLSTPLVRSGASSRQGQSVWWMHKRAFVSRDASVLVRWRQYAGPYLPLRGPPNDDAERERQRVCRGGQAEGLRVSPVLRSVDGGKDGGQSRGCLA